MGAQVFVRTKKRQYRIYVPKALSNLDKAYDATRAWSDDKETPTPVGSRVSLGRPRVSLGR